MMVQGNIPSQGSMPHFSPCNFGSLGVYFSKYFLFPYWLLGEKGKKNKNRSWEPQLSKSWEPCLGADLKTRSCDWEWSRSRGSQPLVLAH